MINLKKLTNDQRGIVHLLLGLVVVGAVSGAGFLGYNVYEHTTSSASTSSTEVHFATYNILGERFDSSDDYSCFFNWDSRRARVIKEVKDANPDIIGLQEVVGTYTTNDEKEKTLNQQQEVKSDMSKAGFDNYGGARSIYWDRKKFKLATDKSFGTETIIGRNKKDNQESKTISFVRLKALSNSKEFYVYNTHLRAGGSSSELTTQLDAIKKIINGRSNTNVPVIYLGDFNGGPSSRQVTEMGALGLKDSMGQTSKRAGSTSSSAVGTCGKPAQGLIDHVLVSSKNVIVNAWNNHGTTSDKEQKPSDHNLVEISATLKY